MPLRDMPQRVNSMSDPPKDSMETGDQQFSFDFRDVTYPVPVFGPDRVCVLGPCWERGQKIFGRRKNETADAFVARVRLDAAKVEVRVRA